MCCVFLYGPTVTLKVPVPDDVAAVIVVVPSPEISATPLAVSVKVITLELLELQVALMVEPLTDAV
jgi:hypothetical protein